MPNVILLSYGLGAGGTERQVALTAIGLQQLGWGVRVAAFRPQGARAAELVAAGIPVHEIPVRSFRGLSLLTGAWTLSRLIRQHKIELLHAFDYPSVVLGIPVARFAGIKAVSSQRAERGFWSAGWQFALRRTDGWAHKVVVNSEWVRRDLIEHHNTAPAKISVLYNGIDTNIFQARDRVRLPDLRGADLIIGSVSVLRPEKRIDTLIEAFARMDRKAAKLLIAGDGPERGSLEALAARLGVATEVVFLGEISDAAQVFRSIDVFVLGSTTEAFSNSLMEAMACGCSVVASNVGGNPELISDGENGILFPSGNAVALSSHLNRLASDTALRSRMAEAALKKIQSHFELPAAAARFASLYEELLSTPHAASKLGTTGPGTSA